MVEFLDCCGLIGHKTDTYALVYAMCFKSHNVTENAKT